MAGGIGMELQLVMGCGEIAFVVVERPQIASSAFARARKEPPGGELSSYR